MYARRIALSQSTAPRSTSRPLIQGYGVPETEEGMLPWDHVVERVERADNYWVGTSGPAGQPHAVPVWGAWVRDALYFGVGPRSARNLERNPRVVVHLESGNDVVILEGRAEQVHNPDPDVSVDLDDALAAKYKWRPSDEDGASQETVAEGMYRLELKTVYAWTQFPTDATRWRF